MKRFFTNYLLHLIVFAVVVGATSAAVAQDGGSQYKIGVVDLKAVFDNYDKQKAMYETLTKDRDKLQAPITALSDQITKDKERYEAESETMSEEARSTLKDKIESDFSKYKADVQQSQEEIDRKEKRIFEEVIVDIQKGVEEVGSKENYHLVFDGSKNRTNNLLYSSTTLNMTQKVIDHLNTAK